MTPPTVYAREDFVDHPARRIALVGSRRVGKTDSQARRSARRAAGWRIVQRDGRWRYERDPAGPVPQIWISGAGEAGAQEALSAGRAYSEQEAELLSDRSLRVVASGASYYRLANGIECHAFAARPTALRGFQGDVRGDECAFFQRWLGPDGMWAATRPCASPTIKNPAGFEVTLTTTASRDDSEARPFFVGDGSAGDPYRTFHRPAPWTLTHCLERGYPEPNLTPEKREAFLEETREECGDDLVFRQEFLCEWSAGGAGFLTQETLNAARYEPSELPSEGDLVAGYDVARSGHHCALARALVDRNAVIWLLPVDAVRGETYAAQEEKIGAAIRAGVRRVCVDQTGAGGPFVERLRSMWPAQIDGLVWTQAIKAELFEGFRGLLETGRLRLAMSDVATLREALAVRKEPMHGGGYRFNGSVGKSHLDRFSAATMAVRAALVFTRRPSAPSITTWGRRLSADLPGGSFSDWRRSEADERERHGLMPLHHNHRGRHTPGS